MKDMCSSIWLMKLSGPKLMLTRPPICSRHHLLRSFSHCNSRTLNDLILTELINAKALTTSRKKQGQKLHVNSVVSRPGQFSLLPIKTTGNNNQARLLPYFYLQRWLFMEHILTFTPLHTLLTFPLMLSSVRLHMPMYIKKERTYCRWVLYNRDAFLVLSRWLYLLSWSRLGRLAKRNRVD